VINPLKKPIFLLIAVGPLVLSALPYIWLSSAHAAGGGGNIRLTPSLATAAANGQAVITVAVYGYEYVCSGTDTYGSHPHTLDPNYCAANGYGTATETGTDVSGAAITISGSGNTVSASQIVTDSSGHGSFTIKSTVAESKTITISSYLPATPANTFTTATVAFAVPVAATPAPVAKPAASQPTPTPTPVPTPAPSVAPPATPSLVSAQVGGAAVDSAKPVVVNEHKPLVLSGKTIPGGVVTLVIHSTPKTVTTTADKNGDWTYTVTGLEVGSHYVEASVADPATGKASPVAKLLSFSVEKDPLSESPKQTEPSHQSSWALWAVVAGIVVLLAAGAWFGWRRWGKSRANQPISS